MTSVWLDSDEIKKAFRVLCVHDNEHTHTHTHTHTQGAFVAVEFTRGTRYANEAVCLIWCHFVLFRSTMASVQANKIKHSLRCVVLHGSVEHTDITVNSRDAILLNIKRQTFHAAGVKYSRTRYYQPWTFIRHQPANTRPERKPC